MGSRLRVVHITRGFEDYMISLLNQLAPFVDLSVVLASADVWMTRYLPDNIEIIESKAPRVSSPKNVLGLPELAKAIRKLSPQIVHCQSGLIWEALTPRWGTGCKLVTTVHDVVQHPHHAKWQFTPQFFLDSLAKRSDAIIVHGQTLKSVAMSRYGIDSRDGNKVQVINHPIISRYGTGQARVQGSQNILFFGTLDRWKGIEVLLPALEQVTDHLPDAKIHIAGGSQTPEYYRQLPYRHHNLRWDIRRQSEDNIKSLFHWADVIVLPYIEASQSGVLHLAQNFAVPIVASDVGALPEVVKQEVNGLVVPPNSPSHLAEALRRMLTDNQLRETVINNLVNYRDLELRSGLIGKKTAELYDRLVRS